MGGKKPLLDKGTCRISNSIGPLAELTPPRFADWSLCNASFQERSDPFQTLPQIQFQSKTWLLLSPTVFFQSGYMQGCLQSSAPVPQGADWLTSAPTNGPVQRGGTLPEVEIEIHLLDKKRPFVTLNGQLSQLCVTRFCAPRSMNLSLSSDKPLGFHIWGLCLAFTPYFIWHLRSCWVFFQPQILN